MRCSILIALTAVVGAFAAPVEQQAAAGLARRASGTATWFYQGGNAGNCGWYSSDSDYVVALDSSAYDGGSHCGKMVVLKNDNTGRTVKAKVADSCPSCGGYGNIDLSKSLFEDIGSGADGVFPITWWFE